MFKITNESEAHTIGKISPNTLVRGDCLNVMKSIPDGIIDCILADPPYG